MTFQLFGFDVMPQDRLFGGWIGKIKLWRIDMVRSLISVYYNDGEWIINILWCRVR